MRRVIAISTVIALLLSVFASVAWAAPGGEKRRPDKTTTTTTTMPLEDCDFETDPGVLTGWHGQKFGYRCLFVEGTPADFVFEIELGTADLIMHPYLAVSDNSEGGGICFRDYGNGRVSEGPIRFDVSLPGDCDDSVDTFRLTVQGTSRGGETLLRMIQPPPTTS